MQQQAALRPFRRPLLKPKGSLLLQQLLPPLLMRCLPPGLPLLLLLLVPRLHGRQRQWRGAEGAGPLPQLLQRRVLLALYLLGSVRRATAWLLSSSRPF